MKVLSASDLTAVSAGHGSSWLMLALGLPHLAIGIVEFGKWSKGMYYEGPQDDPVGEFVYNFFTIKPIESKGN